MRKKTTKQLQEEIEELKQKIASEEKDLEKDSADNQVPEIEPAQPTEQDMLSTKRALCHPGEATYHFLTQWQITNQLLAQIAADLKRNTDLLEEEVEEDKE